MSKPNGLDCSEVQSRLDWDDRTIYLWHMSAPTNRISNSLSLFCGYVCASVILVTVLWLIGLRFRELSFWLAVILTLWFLGSHVYLLLPWRSSKKSAIKRRGLIATALMLMACIIYLTSSHLSPINIGFLIPDEIGPIQWSGFFLQTALNVLLLDALDLFDLHLTSITPESSFSRVIVWIIRFTFVAGVIELFWLTVKDRIRGTTFYGTVRECYHRCIEMPTTQGMQLRIEGKVEKLLDQEPLIIENFIEEFSSNYGLFRIGSSYRI